MSDRDLVARRSPDELRRLKEHVARVRDDPRVAALAAAHDSTGSRFTLAAFQNGVMVGVHPCRLTIGTLALLRLAKSRCIGYGEDESPLSNTDIAKAVFLTSDRTRNLAVSVADDEDELNASVRRFSRWFNADMAACELFEMFRRCGEALRPSAARSDADAGDVFHAPDDAWADDVDLLAHEYGWLDSYVIWEVPIVRVAKLRESISARRSGKPRRASRDESGIAFLQGVEQASKEIAEEGAEDE